MAYDFVNTRTGKVKTVYNVREAKQYERLGHYRPVSNDTCDTCGATGDEPCITSSGDVAAKPHAGR